VHFSGASKKSLKYYPPPQNMMFRVPPAAATEKIPKEAWETQHLSVYAIAGLMTEGVFLF